MPIYEYECENCHHHFDLMQKVTEEAVKQCPKCFEDKAKRLVSVTGFQLRGTGWYATDFKDKPKGRTNADAQSGEKNSATGGNESADSKGTAQGGKVPPVDKAKKEKKQDS